MKTGAGWSPVRFADPGLWWMTRKPEKTLSARIAMQSLLKTIKSDTLAKSYITAVLALHLSTRGNLDMIRVCLEQASKEYRKLSNEERKDMLRPLLMG